MRLLTDENFNGAILRGLVRRWPELDIEIPVTEDTAMPFPYPKIIVALEENSEPSCSRKM